mmetsp:Transcript_53792/g.105211  ORF Transcript_53792/g.105211 Transcript_53792/m.105211 type:complete len:296 (+) Transcript_53792:157-1044(+)
MMLASMRGHEETVRTLLEFGADPEEKDKGGKTALLWAAERGKTGVVRALLQGGADVNGSEKNGHTALSLSVLYGRLFSGEESQVETVRALVEGGADLEAQNVDGTTALVFAHRALFSDLVTLLLESGADGSSLEGVAYTTEEGGARTQSSVFDTFFRTPLPPPVNGPTPEPQTGHASAGGPAGAHPLFGAQHSPSTAGAHPHFGAPALFSAHPWQPAQTLLTAEAFPFPVSFSAQPPVSAQPPGAHTLFGAQQSTQNPPPHSLFGIQQPPSTAGPSRAEPAEPPSLGRVREARWE